MYFSYLDLPPIPQEYISLCYKNLDLIDVDPRLEELNSYRGSMNRATYVPVVVKEWIKQNILMPIFNSSNHDMLLNITRYRIHPTDPSRNGTHGEHIDKERNFAINYYFDLGGEDTCVKWYSDFTKNGGREIAITKKLYPEKWCLLYVNPIVHSVSNIEPNRNRIFISIAVTVDDLVTFDPIKEFKHVIDESSLI